MFISIEACPLCECSDFLSQKPAAPNLYSEKIALNLGISEGELLQQIPNVRCVNCDLAYKKKWFSEEVLNRLFSDLIASHPKGWDTVSKRFTYENFYREVTEFERALAVNDSENTSRYQRALTSLLDSALTPAEQIKYRHLFDAIQSKQINVFWEEDIQTLLVSKFTTPAPFKRFSGFSDMKLWQYLKSKVGPISQYDELGCPLWGLLRHASLEGLDTRYLKRPENNYWNTGCTQNGTHCSDYMKQEFHATEESWSRSDTTKRELVGFFQYLDHLNNPKEFLDEVFMRYAHAAVILDQVDESVYIQHFTGFTNKTMSYIGHHYQRELHLDFDEIKGSGNVLYLFCQRT